MKLGFMVGYSGAKMGGAIAHMKDADKVGFASHNGLPIGKVQEAERLVDVGLARTSTPEEIAKGNE